MSSNEPVKNGCEAIYEMFHILNFGFDHFAITENVEKKAMSVLKRVAIRMVHQNRTCVSFLCWVHLFLSVFFFLLTFHSFRVHSLAMEDREELTQKVNYFITYYVWISV